MSTTIDLDEMNLLSRMRNFEDHLVERKTIKDEKDWKKTAVCGEFDFEQPDVRYFFRRDNRANQREQGDRASRQRTQSFAGFPSAPKKIDEW